MLGSDDDVERLTVDGDVLRLDGRTWPIAPGTGTGSGPEVHDRQHYRLIGWRNNVCGYRRFFSITSLAGLRQEDRAVFDATHVEVKRWFDEGLVDGLRIDHPDGLSDPAGYLAWLRELTGPDAWIVIEKILAVDESLDPTLPVAGTTGYDALREIGGLFVDPTGKQALTDLVDSPGGDYAETPLVARALKAEAVTDTLRQRIGSAVPDHRRRDRFDHPDLPAAVAALLSHVGVYRSDYVSLASVLPVALAETITAEPRFGEPLAIIATAVGTDTEAATRLQQLCGAATAKSMEDCLFYRDARLVSLNEVGGEPEWFGVGAARVPRPGRGPGTAVAVDDDHVVDPRHQARRRRPRPHRRAVAGAVVVGRTGRKRGRCERHRPTLRPHSSCGRTSSGCGRPTVIVTAELRERLHAYAEKAIREAATHTSWNDPDSEFESAVHSWLDEVIDGPVAAELTSLVARLDEYGRSDALGQKLIQLTAPGVPDVYQGTELWDDSLVDPDNRRAGRLRRTARGAAVARSTPSCASRRRHCDCAASDRTPSCPAGTGPCSPADRRASTSSRSCAGTTCWWRSAGGPSGSPKPAGGTRRSGAPRRPVDRSADRTAVRRDGSPSPTCSPSYRSHCWSARVADHEFAVWAPRPRTGAARRRRHAAPHDALRRRLVAGARRRATRCPVRLRPRRRREGAARPALAPPARRRARTVAALGCVARRRGPTTAGPAAPSRGR